MFKDELNLVLNDCFIDLLWLTVAHLKSVDWMLSEMCHLDG